MVYTRWSPDSVIQKLQELHKQGTPLRSDGPNVSVYRAARQYFGSWAAALKAAGIPCYFQVPRSKEQLLNDLRECIAQNPGGSIRKANLSLYITLQRRLGSLEAALKILGLSPDDFPECRRFRWTRSLVIDHLQKVHAAGEWVNKTGLGDRKLSAAAFNHFGSLRSAVVAAGLDPRLARTPARKWSKQFGPRERGHSPFEMVAPVTWTRSSGFDSVGAVVMLESLSPSLMPPMIFSVS
jgi:hypothetical protein